MPKAEIIFNENPKPELGIERFQVNFIPDLGPAESRFFKRFWFACYWIGQQFKR